MEVQEGGGREENWENEGKGKVEEEGGGGQKIKGMRRRKNRRRKQEKREERIFKERKQKGETWRDGCEEGKRTDSRRRRRRCREGGREVH